MAALAAEVGAQHQAQIDARARAKEAAAATLVQVIESVEPALPAICSPFPIRERAKTTGFESNSKPNRRRHSEHGIRVLGDGPKREGTGGLEGSYSGADVYVLESGDMVHLTYSGQWKSMGFDKVHEWTASVREVDADDLLEIYEPRAVSQIVETLEAAVIAQHSGKKQKRTNEFDDMTQLLASVGFLLGSEFARRRRGK